MREQSKTLAHLQQQLRDYGDAYKLIKTERNHTHSQINKLQQVNTRSVCSNASGVPLHVCVCVCAYVYVQLASEMREKWRVLQNEAEVLTTSAQDKEKCCSCSCCVQCTTRCVPQATAEVQSGVLCQVYGEGQ